jgi:hypothetical protein
MANHSDWPSRLFVGPLACLWQRRGRLGRIERSYDYERGDGCLDHTCHQQQQLWLDVGCRCRVGVLGQLVGEARVRFYRAEQPDLYYSRARIRRPACRGSIHRPESQLPDGQCRGQLQVQFLRLLTFTSQGVSSLAAAFPSGRRGRITAKPKSARRLPQTAMLQRPAGRRRRGS